MAQGKEINLESWQQTEDISKRRKYWATASNSNGKEIGRGHNAWKQQKQGKRKTKIQEWLVHWSITKMQKQNKKGKE